MREFFEAFSQSLTRFEEILKEPRTIANRDSAIKRFEFTIELAWKSMQKYLRDQDIVCRSPKECAKEAFRVGIIEDDPLWAHMFDDRNLTVHTYDEDTAQAVYHRLSQYVPVFKQLEHILRNTQ
jgi:nucleotidyltransferase substrate binding protein (TIGR01987 family)